MPTPIAIARNIQRVRFLSKKLNFFLSFAGAQLFADILFYCFKAEDALGSRLFYT